VDYNTVRPHGSLGYRTPEEFAREAAGKMAVEKTAPGGALEILPGFPLSHSLGDGGLSLVALEVQNQTPSATL
jgi:hypothetical protein